MTNDYDRFNSWKGLKHYDKLKSLQKGELVNPVNWHVYPINVCPYKCDFCIMSDRVEGARLPDSTLEKCAEDAGRLGVELVHISGGGEPLAHPYINEFIEKLHDEGVKVALSTNGYYLDRLSAPVDHLRISFNAGTTENYKQIHGVKPNRTIANMSRAKNLATHFGLGYVVTPDNANEAVNVVKLAENVGAEFVHIRPAYLPDKNDEVIKAVQSMPRIESKTVDVFQVSDKFAGFWDGDKYACRATPLHAVLAATGEFLLCQDRLDLRWGDYNEQSFEEIWTDPKHFELMKKAQDCGIRCVETGLNKMITKIDDISVELI